MRIAFFRIFQGSLGSEWPQACFLMLLVLLLSSNLVGLVEFTGGDLRGIELRPTVFLSPDGTFNLPDIILSVDFLLLMTAGVLLALLLPVLTPLAASVLVVFTTMPFIYTGFQMPYRDPQIPMEFSLLVILMLFGMNVLINYFLDTQRKQKLIGVFGKFVPPTIVQELSRQPELLNLDGQSLEMSIFFSDLKDFTGISEQLSPTQLVSLLNEYFTLMTSVLYKHGATIDKYIGDSIMAFWGAPVPQEDHATRAVAAAFEMQAALENFSRELKRRGLPELGMGIGINTGIANVGNMGSTYRLAYTVVGDAVNLSARLESLTRQYCVPIIIGEQTAAQLKGIAVREIDTVTVKGKLRESRIFEPLGPSEELNPETRMLLQRHQEAITLYNQGSLDAIPLMEELSLFPGQSGYYRYMLERLHNKRSEVLELSAGKHY